MTKLLLRLFACSGTRAAVGRLSSIVGVICNLFVAGA